MLSSVPALSTLERYVRELPAGLAHRQNLPPLGLQDHLRRTPSAQVHKLIFFQVDTHLIRTLYEARLWDVQDGLVLERLGEFLFQAHEKIAIPHTQISNFLYQALYQSLLLILRPDDSLRNYFFQHRKALNLQEFAFYARYIVYFDFIPAAILS